MDFKKINAAWGKNCYLNFLEAKEWGDYVQAMACIGDMKDVFPEWAMHMEEELLEAKLDLFSNPSTTWN